MIGGPPAVDVRRKPSVNTQTRTGFTLIELLVVIAIIALLISMLVPSLSIAKDLARRMSCASNMRNIGAAVLVFAADHDDRGPGGASRPKIENVQSNSSFSWVNILNVEYFKEDHIQRMGPTPAPGKLYCPSMQYWASDHPRAYMLNLDASGGPGWGDDGRAGLYGLAITDLDPLSNTYGWILDEYHLGAQLSLFPKPSYQFLSVENERGADYCDGGRTSPLYGVNLGGSDQHPPWSTHDGTRAFRHTEMGNFLFLDTHVEVLGPDDDMTSAERFKINY